MEEVPLVVSRHRAGATLCYPGGRFPSPKAAPCTSRFLRRTQMALSERPETELQSEHSLSFSAAPRLSGPLLLPMREG